MSTLTAVIVGAGRMGGTIDDEMGDYPRFVLPYSHAAGYAAIPDVDLVAFADTDEAKCNALQERYGVPRGYRDRIVPLHMDVTHELPFADGYFDTIFCTNSSSFYGGSVAFLRHLLPHLKPGGQLCIGSEVLSDEFTAEQFANPPYVYAFPLPLPNEHVNVFEDDFRKQHTPPKRSLFVLTAHKL